MATPVFNPKDSYEEIETGATPITSAARAPDSTVPVFNPIGETEDVSDIYDPVSRSIRRPPIRPVPTWERRLEEAQGVRPGLDPENEFGAARYTEGGTYVPTPLNIARGAADLVARSFEYGAAAGNTALDYLDKAAIETGLANLPEKLGINELYGQRMQILPGSAIGALGEAFPLGGIEAGAISPRVPTRLAPEQEEAYLDVARRGTAEDIMKFSDENNLGVSKTDVDTFIAERNKAGGEITPEVQYNLPLEEQQTLPFEGPTPEQRALGSRLQTEADAFVTRKAAEELPDYRQRELPLEIPPQQTSFDFGEAQPPVQKAVAPRKLLEPETSDIVNNAVNKINEMTGDWKNSPSIEVFDNFDDLDGVDPDAIGVTRPDNSVAINMKSVGAEAEALGVSIDDVLSAVTYHESLGHYGLTERFGRGLNDFLIGLYDNSESFKNRVNKRMADNPDDYLDDTNPLASHAEEVLAEMSEKGQISPTMLNRLRDNIKGLGREMGLQIKYSDREIRSILSTAHDAVVNGKKNRSPGLRNRYMYAGVRARGGPKEKGDWFTGPDKKWRYEISDEAAQFDDDRFQQLAEFGNSLKGEDFAVDRLQYLLDHPELYKAYPELRNYQVRILPEGEGMGLFDEKAKTISIARSVTNKKSTALHEIQHAIQEIEDTARGGSPGIALDLMADSHMKSTLKNVTEWDKKRLQTESQMLELLREVADTTEAYDARIDYDTVKKLYKEAENNPTPEAIRLFEEATLRYYEAEDRLKKKIGFPTKPSDADITEFENLKFRLIENDPDAMLDAFERGLEERYFATEAQDILLRDKKPSRAAMKEALEDYRSSDYNIGFQAYESIFGEVEARDVQARMDMNMEQRRATKPYSSQDKIAPAHSYIIHRWSKASAETKADMVSSSIRDERNTPGDPAVRMTAELFGIAPDRIPKALTETDFLGQVFLTRRMLENPRTPKYMKRRTIGKGSDGPRRGSMNEPDETADTPRTIIPNYTSKRNVEDILQEVTPESVPESWDQWIEESGKIKMTGKMAQNLALGVEVPELKAAEKYLLESANRIHDLSAKVARGAATEREAYLLGAEMERAQNVARSIKEVVSNSARILNSRKIEVASDRALSDGIRNMLLSIGKGDLKDPAKIQKFAQKLQTMDKRERAIGKALEIFANAINLPRSIMSSMDFSAPLRQGIFFVGRKELWKNIPSMFKQFGSDAAFDAVKQSIEARPTHSLMKKADLEITELGHKLTKREEAFISEWAHRIPVAGKAIKASERAYTGFLNKLRADVFDDLVRQYENAGIDLRQDDKALKDISKFINNATGRGDLGKFTQASPILSGVFFSPRLIASRVRMLNPNTYIKLDPIVRKNALKSLASFGAIATTALGLATMMGADVEVDPRSSDFAKIRTGNTRYDILGGFGQYLTLATRMATNEKKNAKGEVQELGKKYGSDTRVDVLANFGINKFSPVASFITDYLRGKNAIGEPFDAKQKAVESFIPLFLQDATELVKEEGAKGVPMSLPGLFGVGINTYDIDLGYDAYGRDIEKLLKSDKPESDPVVLETQRLIKDESNTFDGLPSAPKSFKEDGVKYQLTDEQSKEWQRVMGEYTHQYLTEDMASEDYVNGDDQDKIATVKKAHDDAFADTKVYFLDNVINQPTESVE